MKKQIIKTVMIMCCIVYTYPVTAKAVDNVLDYNTLMYQTYQNNWQSSFSTTQWKNYTQWNDEMSDIAVCSLCSQNPSSLPTKLSGTIGLDADLIALVTHGSYSGSGTTFTGLFCSYEQNTMGLSTSIDPGSTETEIFLLQSCSASSTNATSEWYGFRNAHHYGALIHAGCYGTCSIAKVGVNSTWNEIGDSIADSQQTIWNSWKDGLSVGFHENPIVIWAVGNKTNGDCSSRALNVTFQNRMSYTKYTYSSNLALSNSSYEMCGYYATMND